MGRVKPREPVADRETDIRDAKQVYLSDEVTSIHSVHSILSISYSTLQNRCRGAQPQSIAHKKEQLLTPEEEKSIVHFCEAVNDLGYALQGKMVKDFGLSLLTPYCRWQLGKHWITHIVIWHPGITSKFSKGLDSHRAKANDPVILRDFFSKVS
jgi:hypothetical protein